MLSAHGPPHPDDALHRLPDGELLARLRAMGGTPDSFFGSPELIELALPIVRADLELLETHVVAPRPRVDCPVVAFAGDGDRLAPRDHLEAWRPLVAGSFTLITLAGEHFFVHDLEPAVLGHVARQCRDKLGSA
jgi:surfactin synthase thioesterase subunit